MNEFSEGYLPCPDTHPWGYEYNYDYQMCCSEEPVIKFGGPICEVEALYREWDNGEDTDGKN